MHHQELSKPYQPNLVLRALYAQVFDRITIDPVWVEENRRLAEQGSIVHVMGNLNLIDFLALDHFSKRLSLPSLRFVNDLGLWVANPDLGQGWTDLFYPRSPATQFRHALTSGGAALLFLRRPHSMVDLAIGATRRRGRAEGEALLKALFELQRRSERPILLVPQVFVWNKRPEPKFYQPLDVMLAPRDWPNAALSMAQFLYNYQHVAMRVGEPIAVRDLLRDAEHEPEEAVRQRVTYVLLRRIERERRGVTGPEEKPPDRVRLEIVQSPRLRAVIDDLAGEREAVRAVLTGQALAMLRELQARPDPTTRKGLELLFHRVFQRVYAGIEFDPGDLERVRRAARDGTLVILPSHKSHFDYFTLGYLFLRNNLPMPVIAAGDNLNFFPLGQLLRRGGAFFIRRAFKGDRLYAAVVDGYIRRLLREGHAIELFLEGARSRTGKLLTPKFGLLNMVVDAALTVSDQQTYFVPVSIGYERIAELGAFERELGGGDKRRENAVELLKAPEVLRHRYGRLNLQFGQILSLDEVRAELGLTGEAPLLPAKRRALVMRIGNRVMDEINRVTAVTPSSLVALSLLTAPPRRAVSHDELHGRCDRLLGVLRELGARITTATALGDGPLRAEALREGVQLFLDSELLAVSEEHLPTWPRRLRSRPRPSARATYVVPDAKRLALDVSKNMILHFFVERALVATALSMPGGRPVSRDLVRERVQRLSRLFKHEFRFRTDASFDEIFTGTVTAMLAHGELAESPEGLDVGPGHAGAGGRWWIDTYAAMLTNFLEGYRIAARTLASLVKAPSTEKDLVRRALAVGGQMVKSGEVKRREALCKPLLQNAIAALIDEESLIRSGDKLELAESFRDAEAVCTIEARIAGFLGDE